VNKSSHFSKEISIVEIKKSTVEVSSDRGAFAEIFRKNDLNRRFKQVKLRLKKFINNAL